LNRANTHPDFMLLEPEETGKAIKIDQVRALSSFISKTSQQGGYKLAIIEPAEAMNGSAANALLKSLEEPAGNTLLLLISHINSGVMATIRSRCQLQVMSAPFPEQGLQWLQPLIGDGNATELLALANGAPLAALGLASSDALEQRSSLIKGLESVLQGGESPLVVAKQWLNYEPRELLEWLLKWLHGIACVQAGGKSPVEFSSLVLEFSQRLSGPFLYRFIDKVMQIKRHFLSGSNPNKQLLLEELLMDWSVLARQARAAKS
jgi:DNA polymerase-3 subunit delta'